MTQATLQKHITEIDNRNVDIYYTETATGIKICETWYSDTKDRVSLNMTEQKEVITEIAEAI